MSPITRLLSTTAIAAAMAFSMAACESTQTAKVPTNAQKVASGNGTTDYRTADAGMLYIYDKTWNRIVYSGDVKPDQDVKVDTFKNAVIIDNRTVAEQLNLGGGDNFQFYLDPSSSTTTTVERRTVTEREIHD